MSTLPKPHVLQKLGCFWTDQVSWSHSSMQLRSKHMHYLIKTSIVGLKATVYYWEEIIFARLNVFVHKLWMDEGTRIISLTSQTVIVFIQMSINDDSRCDKHKQGVWNTKGAANMLNMRMSVSVTETQPLSHYSPVSLRLLINHLLIGRGKSWAVFAQVHSHDGEICGFLTVRRRGQTLQWTPGVDGELSLGSTQTGSAPRHIT